MSKQPPPAPTASAVNPCPTVIQIVGRPGTGSFTQHQRTTRPPPIKNKEHYEATTPVEHKSAPQNTYRTESVQESNLNISASLQSETIPDQFQEDHAPETINVTPHKEADYQSSKKKLSSRKKNRKVSLWKANIRKKARTEGWLVGCFGFNGPLRQYFSLYRAVSQRGGERGERIDESKNVQTTPTRTYCKRNRPLPYCYQNCRTPRHWKFTQHHRTTRPPHRTEGREYNTKEGKAVPKRSVKPQNCKKRRFRCNTKFTEVEREQIFQT